MNDSIYILIIPTGTEKLNIKVWTFLKNNEELGILTKVRGMNTRLSINQILYDMVQFEINPNSLV